MSKIDPRLKFIQQEPKDGLSELEAFGNFAIEAESVPAPKVRVLLQFKKNLKKIEKAGFKPFTVAEDVASGELELSKLDAIAGLSDVVMIESSRPMTDELDISMPEVRADIVHTGPPGYRGSGVIVGIIDSGIDFTHECFTKPNGTSRILSIWDQSLIPQGSESNPAGYTYGVEYTKTDIDSALAAADPFSVVRHKDGATRSGHGTHVTGIAAGDGSPAGNSNPAFTYVGVAPEADIIIVANRVTTQALGNSTNTLDAVKFIFDKASALGKPVVINQSQGDNLGPHDGTSLLERGIDNLLGGKGNVMVKSAGNAADDGIHASGTVASGGTEIVQFMIPNGDTSPDTLDIWYNNADRFDICFTPPGGSASAWVSPNNTTLLNLPNGNSLFVDSTLNDPNNTDNRIYVQFTKGTAAAIQPGNWTFSLRGATVVNGGFHAWFERGRVIPQFTGTHMNNACTISIPGTSQEIIAAGSYITSGAGAGDISSFSSIGPTRDGRQKPELSAPGQWITSARADGISMGSGVYHQLAGTSMSAPHIAGAAALMLQKNKELTQAQIKKCLMDNARADAFTGSVPNNTWGNGKLDVKAAVDCVRIPITLKFLDDPTPTFKFKDDIPTLKFKDDLPTFKFKDDPQPTLKFKDDPLPTLKFKDDPQPTLKFKDDPMPTLKFLDDPIKTLKFKDDISTNPSVDLVKQPGLDKSPVSDRITKPVHRQPAPFVMSTPHHSNAWSGSFPEAFQAELEQYQAQLAQYEEMLTSMYEAAQQGTLTPEEQQHFQELQQEYQTLLEYVQQMQG